MARDNEAFLRQLWGMEDELVRAGLEPMPKWWRREISRFYRTGKRRWVVRKGRRVFASTCVAPRLAVAESLFGDHEHIAGSPPLIYAFLSVQRGESAWRLTGVTAVLDALGVKHEQAGTTVRLRGLPAVFQIITASFRATVGGTVAFAWCDEVSSWNDDKVSKNPAEQVIGTLAPALATLSDARLFLVSSPLTTLDYHAKQFALGETPEQCVSFGTTWDITAGSVRQLTEEQTRAMEPNIHWWKRGYAAIPVDGVEDDWFGDATDNALTSDPAPPIQRGQRPIIAIDPAFAQDHFGYAVACSEPSDTTDPTTGRTYRRTRLNQCGAWPPEESPRKTLVRLRDEIALPAWRASGQDGLPRVYTDQAEFYSLREVARDVGLILELVAWTGGSGEGSKLARFRQVRTAMREGAFLVHRTEPVVSEFRSVIGVLTPSGNERLEFKRSGEGHLDKLSAAVLAGSIALERSPRAAEPAPVVLDRGQLLRQQAIRDAEKRQKQQWARDPRVVMRAALGRR